MRAKGEGRPGPIAYGRALLRLRSRFGGTTLPVETVPVASAMGRVSAAEVRSRVRLPAKAISAMDGYGVRSRETRDTSSRRPGFFAVVGPGFGARTSDLRPGRAVYLSTGSPLPPGVDAVVRVEDTWRVGGGVLVSRPVPAGKNVEAAGDDMEAGRRIAAVGDRLTPAVVSLMMEAGVTNVRVFRRAKVGIISAGEGLVGLGRARRDGERVNNYAHLISGYVSELGAEPRLLGIAGDRPRELSRLVASEIGGLDMLLVIGRSSAGADDHAVDEISRVPGARILFHGIDLLPVRPSGLVMVRGKPVCVIPAKAVSSALAFFLVSAPVLNLMNGMGTASRPGTAIATVMDGFANGHARDAVFLMKRVRGGVRSLRWGSNLSSSLAEASGFAVVAAGRRLRRGERVSVSLFPSEPGPDGRS